MTACQISAAVGGSAVHVAAGRVRDKALRIAAHLMEVSATDVELVSGGFVPRGVPDRSLSFEQVAAAGLDPKDTTCVDLPVPDYEKSVGASIKGKRIGVPKEYRIPGMANEIETLWQRGAQWLSDAGAEMVEISLPNTRHAFYR